METGSTKSKVLIDNTFSSQDSGIYHLLLHFDGDTLSYGVVDSGTNVFVVFGKEKRDTQGIASFLDQIFETNEILSLEFKKASLSISGLADTLVPTSFFEKDKARDLINFAHGNAETQVKHQSIAKLKATLIHREDKNISSIFLKNHPYGQVFLNSGLLIESLLRVNRFDKSEKVYVDVRLHSFDMFILVAGKLILYNQYDIETPNDLLYHVLNTMQQVGLDSQKSKVILSGAIEEGDAVYKLLNQYINNLSFNTGLDDYEFGLQLKNVKEHQYMSLLNLSVCV